MEEMVPQITAVILQDNPKLPTENINTYPS